MSDFKTTDYKHFEGTPIKVKTHKDELLTLTVALCEYGMGVTIKGKNTTYALCLNGPDAINQQYYEKFAHEYDEDFQYVIQCLESGETMNWLRHEKQRNPNYKLPQMGMAYCATGL